MGMELREQVAAGEMAAEEAKKKYAAAEEQMWRRFRMAEEQAGGEHHASQDLAKLKASIETRLKAMGMELRKQVADGEMTAEDAKARYDAAEQQMWRRYRQAEKKAVADD
jgi:polyhydroxyalkanoate synthesis regulator phasin